MQAPELQQRVPLVRAMLRREFNQRTALPVWQLKLPVRKPMALLSKEWD
jgi:hypothetical protein